MNPVLFQDYYIDNIEERESMILASKYIIQETMKFITCASYYGTGSSAVTNLLMECDNVFCLGDYEFRFLQDPDGISDLEYNLVENNHRHNSGYAIKRYENNVRFLNGNSFIKKYNRFFGDKWLECSNRYIKNLIQLKYNGYWHQEVRDKGRFVYFVERAINKFMHSVLRVGRERNYTLFMGKNYEYLSYPSKEFYNHTRRYIDELFDSINADNKEFVMVDQLVPPSNTKRYVNYFNDIKVVCVDRDPRDLFILEREFWNGAILPKSVKDYCIWYRTTRLHRKQEQDELDKVLRIRFEDLIYKYDETSKAVLQFCGIDSTHHKEKRTILIPEVSINNTNLKERFPRYKDDMEYIEKHLAEYLYNFESVGPIKK